MLTNSPSARWKEQEKTISNIERNRAKIKSTLHWDLALGAFFLCHFPTCKSASHAQCPEFPVEDPSELILTYGKLVTKIRKQTQATFN